MEELMTGLLNRSWDKKVWQRNLNDLFPTFWKVTKEKQGGRGGERPLRGLCGAGFWSGSKQFHGQTLNKPGGQEQVKGKNEGSDLTFQNAFCRRNTKTITLWPAFSTLRSDRLQQTDAKHNCHKKLRRYPGKRCNSINTTPKMSFSPNF